MYTFLEQWISRNSVAPRRVLTKNIILFNCIIIYPRDNIVEWHALWHLNLFCRSLRKSKRKENWVAKWAIYQQRTTLWVRIVISTCDWTKMCTLKYTGRLDLVCTLPGKQKRRAFLDLLLEANEKEDDPLTMDEIRDQTNTFMFAVSSTLEILIGASFGPTPDTSITNVNNLLPGTRYDCCSVKLGDLLSR